MNISARAKSFAKAKLMADMKAGVGCRLRALREVKGLSQAAFAKLVGESQSVYHKWEDGVSFPNPVIVRQICVRFKVDFNFLYLGQYKGLEDADLAVAIERKMIQPAQETSRTVQSKGKDRA